jgi:hypothetical protein
MATNDVPRGVQLLRDCAVSGQAVTLTPPEIRQVLDYFGAGPKQTDHALRQWALEQAIRSGASVDEAFGEAERLCKFVTLED